MPTKTFNYDRKEVESKTHPNQLPIAKALMQKTF